MFSGHEESGGEIVENGEKYKLFYGMSSKKAMEHSGSVANYRTSEEKNPYKI